jgi:hypothetical protein
MQIVRRKRLGNDTEDITFIASPLRSNAVAVLDGYDVITLDLAAQQPPPITQTGAGAAVAPRPAPFNILGLGVKAGPRGIVFAPTQNRFYFNDNLQPAILFTASSSGEPQKPLALQYLNGIPQGVEGLDYIPATANQFADSLLMMTNFPDDELGLQSRVQIISFQGQVLREIVPQGDLAGVFLTGITYRRQGTLLVSSDDDETVCEIDFNGEVIRSFSLSSPPGQIVLQGIEGLATTRDGLLGAAGGIDGFLALFREGVDTPTRVIDYRIGFGLSLPSGIAWDSSAGQLLLLSADRTQPSQVVSAIGPALESSNTRFPVDQLTRKITYLPSEELIAATHNNNPRGILLFNQKGGASGQIDTTAFGTPQVLSFIPSTREFVVVFRDNADPSKRSKLFLLTRKGGLSRVIDLAPSGITRITVACYFGNGLGGRFFVVDGPTNLGFITDLRGNVLTKVDIRGELGLLTPTAATEITSGPDAGALAIANGESSEVVVFRLS